MIYPTIEDIVDLNRRHIQSTGGLWIGQDNLRNRASLEWVLDAIQYPLFGEMVYETISAKAAILVWVIINDHVFFDACKRTAMSAMLVLTRVNGYRFIMSGNDIISMALKVADHTHSGCTQSELEAWIEQGCSAR